MWTLAEIAQHIGGDVVGDSEYTVASVATLQSGQANQISFLSNSKYSKYLANTNAGAVIISAKMVDSVPNNAIVVDDPYVAYAKAAALLNPLTENNIGVNPTAFIADNCFIEPSVLIGAQSVIGAGVILEKNVIIGPGCILLDNVKVAEGSRLVANVTLCKDTQIGQRALIHPGVVIGADGFGIANDHGKWIKVPQLGSVRVGDDVEIGANTTIDRGAIDDTLIGDGVKLDNQIQIGHNVTIGDNTVIAGCVGIAGSTSIGRNCAIGGGACLSGHLDIVDNVQITGMTMVTKSLTRSGVYSSGIPAEKTATWHRHVIRYRQLDKLTERVKQLEIQNKQG
jgi:UDP-3-O-[3-hydroxymyristoyl] glucosamine N-acyltransferase